MKKLFMLLAFLSTAIAFAGTQSQLVQVDGKLTKLGEFYGIKTTGSLQLLINISKDSGEKFGECLEGTYVLNLESNDSSNIGLDIVEMDCRIKN